MLDSVKVTGTRRTGNHDPARPSLFQNAAEARPGRQFPAPAARLDGPEERGRHVSDGPHPARPTVNHARRCHRRPARSCSSSRVGLRPSIHSIRRGFLASALAIAIS